MASQELGFGFLLADTARLMRRAFQHHLEDTGLTLAQARALVYVARSEGIRQVDLADILEVQPITLARLIDQLEKNNLVERRSDPVDRRAYQLYLLPAAAKHLKAIKAVGKKLCALAFEGLDDQHVECVLSGLTRVRENFSTR